MGLITNTIARMIKAGSGTNMNPIAVVARGIDMLDNEFKIDFSPQMVYDFSDKSKFMKWRITTDADFMGKSTAQSSYNEEDRTAVFEGNLDLSVDTKARVDHQIARGGFAAIRSPHFDIPLTLDKFDSFEIRHKGDGRVYVLNILPFDKYMDEEWRLYQVPLITKAGEWQTTILPFASFLSAYRGKIDTIQAVAYNGQQAIMGVGVLMAQRQPGPFRLELDWWKAINNKERKAASRYDPNNMNQ